MSHLNDFKPAKGRRAINEEEIDLAISRAIGDNVRHLIRATMASLPATSLIRTSFFIRDDKRILSNIFPGQCVQYEYPHTSKTMQRMEVTLTPADTVDMLPHGTLKERIAKWEDTKEYFYSLVQDALKSYRDEVAQRAG